MLSKDQRLRKESDFRSVKRNKFAQAASQYFYFIAARGKGNKSRLGIVLPGKVGKAVLRNRIRRIFVEGYRDIKAEITEPVDIVIYPTTESGGLTSKDAAKLLEFSFKKAKIL